MPLAFSRPGWCRLAAVVVGAFVLTMVALRWDAHTGFTSLIRFGELQAPRQLPELRPLPLALAPNLGYDGQYYAQLAVSLDPSRPELVSALGNPVYRSRRILLPAIAHVAGFGDPWLVLQAYALLNVVAWLVLACIWWRETPPEDGPGLARWCGAMLALGTLDSVQMALTDLPCVLLLVLAVRASRGIRPPLAALWLSLASLARETGLLGLFAVFDARPAVTQRTGVVRTWALRALALAPLVAWVAWLRWLFPQAATEIAGNFDWPGFAWTRSLVRCAQEIASGNADSRYTFGLVGALGLAWQSVFILSRWRTGDPWVRMAAPFAVLFWFLGDYVWNGYWAVARTCLPMTFAFVRLAPLRAPWWLANLSILHAVYRMIP
ncbi:MAG: hypothetical protein ACREIA_11295 [Opitutaceae bacterium]